jgi:hypothetical protein
MLTETLHLSEFLRCRGSCRERGCISDALKPPVYLSLPVLIRMDLVHIQDCRADGIAHFLSIRRRIPDNQNDPIAIQFPLDGRFAMLF